MVPGVPEVWSMAHSIGPGLTNYLRIFQQNSSYIYVHVRLSVVTTILRHGLTEIRPKMDKISILTAKKKIYSNQISKGEQAGLL